VGKYPEQHENAHDQQVQCPADDTQRVDGSKLHFLAENICQRIDDLGGGQAKNEVDGGIGGHQHRVDQRKRSDPVEPVRAGAQAVLVAQLELEWGGNRFGSGGLGGGFSKHGAPVNAEGGMLNAE
jgi:hypothetical protein